MDRKIYDFTKKASRTAYEEAIRTGDGGSIEGHRHPDYALVDHAHEGSGGGSGGMNVVSITQEEYDALETKSVETLYVVI